MSKIQDLRSHRFSQLIGLELKASFARNETSQAEVAEKLGHSKSGYSKWLNAKPSMPLEALLNTCELIGADPRQILDAAYKRLITEMGEYEPERSDAGEVDLSMLSEDEKKQIVLDKLKRGDMSLAANYDINKEAERDYYPDAGA